jgi:hypothetical protein
MGQHLRVDGIGLHLRFGDDSLLGWIHERDLHRLNEDIVDVAVAPGDFQSEVGAGLLLRKPLQIFPNIPDAILRRRVAVVGHHGDL